MSTKKLREKVDLITARADLAEFIEELRRDLLDNPSGWENDSLDTYLEAMRGWVLDMDGYFKNVGAPFSENQSWQMLAMILLAARTYE